MRPILKWNGGKRREIKYFKKYVPKDFDTYIEPFIGGGALFFDLAPGRAVINDYNRWLYDFYFQLSCDWPTVQNDINRLAARYNLLTDDKSKRDMFFRARDCLNTEDYSNYCYAAIYYFINRLCFSGKMEMNHWDKFNMGWGHYKHMAPSITDEQVALVNSAVLLTTDFSEVLQKATKEDDFVFLDPPYLSSDQRGYGRAGNFRWEDFKRLKACFVELNCKALMVVNDTPEMEILFAPYVQGRYSRSYDLNSKSKKTASHIIIANYDIQKEAANNE